MMGNITKTHSRQCEGETTPQLFDVWFDPIESVVREREFIEELIRGELDAALARPRYERSKKAGHEATPGVTGHRHGSRTRSLTGNFGPIVIAAPRARLETPVGVLDAADSHDLRSVFGRWTPEPGVNDPVGFADELRAQAESVVHSRARGAVGLSDLQRARATLDESRADAGEGRKLRG